jgi:enoyl-CoA hydratase/carnithine racemase
VSTVHPRIALTRDPELDEALRRARPLLGERKPTATLARELILRGARELLANQSTELERWLDERHATRIERSTEQVRAAAAKLGAPDPAKPYSVSQTLEQQRGERL